MGTWENTGSNGIWANSRKQILQAFGVASWPVLQQEDQIRISKAEERAVEVVNVSCFHCGHEILHDSGQVTEAAAFCEDAVEVALYKRQGRDGVS
jgi:hypothetical protein